MPDYDAWANSVRTRDWQDSGEAWQFRLDTAIKAQFYAREISDDVFRADCSSRCISAVRSSPAVSHHDQERYDREHKRNA